MNAGQNSGGTFDSGKNRTILLGLGVAGLLGLFALSELRKKETPNTEKHLIQYIGKELSPENPETITTVQANFSGKVLQSYHEIKKSITYFERSSDNNEKITHHQKGKNQLKNLINRLYEIDKKNYKIHNFRESVFGEKIEGVEIQVIILHLGEKLGLKIKIPHIIRIEDANRNSDSSNDLVKY